MLSLDYLGSGSPDCPLIRLHSFTDSDIAELRALFMELAEHEGRTALLQAMPWVRTDAACELTLISGRRSAGVRHISGNSFVWTLDSEGWLEAADKLLPITTQPGTFQWLADVDVRVLVSFDGQW